MTSPWQGPSDGVDGSGKVAGVALPPGMMEAANGVAPETMGTATAVLGTERGGGGLGREQQPGAVRQKAVARGIERSQGVHQQQRQRQQVAPKTAEPVAAHKVRMKNKSGEREPDKRPFLQYCVHFHSIAYIFTCLVL